MSYLAHYGTPRHSGRYPWGSGKNPQRSKNMLQRAKEYEEQGLTPVEVARAFGMSTGDFRAVKKLWTEDVRQNDIRRCSELKDKGYSLAAISRATGLPWSTVKNYLDPVKQARTDKTVNIANELKKSLEEKPYLDVGEGVNRQLNISEEQLKAATAMLEEQGYRVKTFQEPQTTNPRQKTTIKVIMRPGVEDAEMYANKDRITSPEGLYFEDYGAVAKRIKPVKSIDSSRVSIKYAKEGGSEKDGVIEIRPGVEDLTLGGRKYAQVRIAVDDGYYLKGMAVYGDPAKMPKGKDIVFNTNKHQDKAMMDGDNGVLKPMKDDKTNPFGASFTQWEYTGADGKKHTSPINIVNDDEDWGKWTKSLSPQFLSKQRKELAEKQLKLAYDMKKSEYDEIMSINNPTVKRKLLESFSEDCDSASVHLKAAALPRQGSYVILPIPSLKDNEIYAPQYKEGEEVVLVRYPHAGTFEMPRLRVVHRNEEGKRVLGTSPAHAIGINSHVAQQLSGADFDGDTVLVIPTVGQKIKAGDTVPKGSPLDKLKNFDPSEAYPNPPGAKKTGSKGEGFNKGKEMGMVSNLITDMTIKGATPDEIAKAVRHSMVVIDAEKHNLNWRASENDNGIKQLKLKYQGGEKAGASTLISKAKGDYRIPERKLVRNYNDMTPDEQKRYDEGQIIYRETGRTYKDYKTGKIKPALEKVQRLSAYDDALDPSINSGYTIEVVYGQHSNRMKALANQARKDMRNTGLLQQNKTAAKTYAKEVKELDAKLNVAALNAPKERQANLIANKIVKTAIDSNPSLKDDENKDKLKKVRSKAISNARDLTGAHRTQIDITPKEWEAIEAGAVSDTKLTQILRYADMDTVRKMATPRSDTGMKANARARAQTLLNQGIAPSVVAEEVGVSYNTLMREFDNFKDVGDD